MKRIPTCHPDRKYSAKGLCYSCYRMQYIKTWRNSRDANCHPDKPHYAKGLCFPCYNRSRDPQIMKDRKLRYGFGLSLDEYNEMYKQQEGQCAICHEQHDVLCVDHDHAIPDKRLSIRNLLCHDCNVGLGRFFDKPERLESAIKYLMQHGIA